MAGAKAQDKAYAFLKKQILDGALNADASIVPDHRPHENTPVE